MASAPDWRRPSTPSAARGQSGPEFHEVREVPRPPRQGPPPASAADATASAEPCHLCGGPADSRVGVEVLPGIEITACVCQRCLNLAAQAAQVSRQLLGK